MLAAFLMTVAALAVTQFTGMITTAGLSEKWSALEAGNALLFFGIAELIAIGPALAVFRWLAVKFAGSPPPWWSLLLLALLGAVSAAINFFIGMVLMNR